MGKCEREKRLVNVEGNRQKQHTIRLILLQGETVVKKLTKRGMKFANHRRTKKALYLHSDFHTCFFGGNQLLGTQVYI